MRVVYFLFVQAHVILYAALADLCAVEIKHVKERLKIKLTASPKALKFVEVA
jgi:hypothetical protein